MNWNTKRQGMVVGISQESGKDFHSGRSGFSVSILLGTFYTALAIYSIFPKFSPVAKKEIRQFVGTG